MIRFATATALLAALAAGSAASAATFGWTGATFATGNPWSDAETWESFDDPDSDPLNDGFPGPTDGIFINGFFSTNMSLDGASRTVTTGDIRVADANTFTISVTGGANVLTFDGNFAMGGDLGSRTSAGRFGVQGFFNGTLDFNANANLLAGTLFTSQTNQFSNGRFNFGGFLQFNGGAVEGNDVFFEAGSAIQGTLSDIDGQFTMGDTNSDGSGDSFLSIVDDEVGLGITGLGDAVVNAGDVFTIVSGYDTWNGGTFSGLAQGATTTIDGVDFTIDYGTSAITLIASEPPVIPEPASIALVTLGGTLLLARRRRA